MKLSRREFFALGAALTLAACGGSRDTEEDHADESPEAEVAPEVAPEPLVDEQTTYEVFRVDIQHGVGGEVEVLTDAALFDGFYAELSPDGTFNFDINGVVFNGALTDSGKTMRHSYSGGTYDVEQLLLNGETFANVGTVDFEAYAIDGYILVDMNTTVDGEWQDWMFYLWKKTDA